MMLLLLALLGACHHAPPPPPPPPVSVVPAPTAEDAFAAGVAALDQPAEARVHFEASLALDPTHAGTWLNLGWCAYKLGDLPGAEAAWRSAMALDPERAEPTLALGRLLGPGSTAGEALWVSWLDRHPDDQALRLELATALSAAGRDEAAILQAEEALLRQPDEASMLRVLALGRLRLGQIDQAKAPIARLQELTADPLLRFELLAQAGRTEELEAAYRVWFKRPPANATASQILGARLDYGMLLSKNGSPKADSWWAETERSADRELARGALSADDLRLTQLQYLRVEPMRLAYLAMRLDGPGGAQLPKKQAEEQLRHQLEDKAHAMAALQDAYLPIVQRGPGPWAVASLVRIGEIKEDMATAILESWVPPWLTEDQRELYAMMVEDRASPLRQAAADAYSAALDMADTLGLFNEDTAGATARLAALRPSKFLAAFEVVAPPVTLPAPALRW